MKSKIFQISLITPLLFLSNVLLANEEGASQGGWLEWSYQNIIFIIGGAVVVGALGSIFYLFNKMIEIQKIRLMQELGMEAVEEVKLMNQESWWSKMYKSLTKAVPIEKEKDVMLDHDYDGIKELDNVLPPWWVYTFYISIFFAVFYIGYWHFSDYGYSSAEEYEMDMEAAQKAVDKYLASQADMVDETTVELLIDEGQLGLGQSIFETKCSVCHGQLGEGNTIGPNLTDQYWLNGGGIKNVFKTIKYGVPEKGMISWKSQLRPADMQRVASYILSLQGTNPPNAKDPQGELYTEENPDEKLGMK